jgi:hypothetical protein
VELIRGDPFVTRGANARVHVPAPLRQLRLSLDSFAWDAITEESERLGVPVEEIANFSVLYYLADLDSGRISRRIPSSGSLVGPSD